MTCHLRTDDNELNVRAEYACGLRWPLPEGDKAVYEGDSSYVHHKYIDCPACRPFAKRFGTPLSELAGRPDGTLAGQRRYEEFKRIAASYGYD